MILKRGIIMNKIIEEWLVELAEISELEECLLDVFENSMAGPLK